MPIIRENMKYLGNGFYLVKTQAGFRKAIKHFNGESKETREVYSYPRTYPSIVHLSSGYRGYHYTSVGVLSVSTFMKRLTDALISNEETLQETK